MSLQHLVNPNKSRRIAYFRYPIPEYMGIYTPSAAVFRSGRLHSVADNDTIAHMRQQRCLVFDKLVGSSC